MVFLCKKGECYLKALPVFYAKSLTKPATVTRITTVTTIATITAAVIWVAVVG